MNKEKQKHFIMDDSSVNLKKLQEQIVEEIKAGEYLLGQDSLRL